MRLLLPALLASSLLAGVAFANDRDAHVNALTSPQNTRQSGNPITSVRDANAKKSAVARAKSYETMTLTVGGITNGKPIPNTFTYCAPDGNGGTRDSENLSPAITWSPPPEGTKSMVLLVVDRDVPADLSKANVPGTAIELKDARQNFYHWVLVDIPPSVGGILQGKDSNGLAPGGKPFGKMEYGTDGQNDYGRVSQGSHGGYDGPCPPWNDKRMHQYHFILYALDIPTLKLPDPVHGAQVEVVVKNHILSQAEVVGTYSTNPDWLRQQEKEQKQQAREARTPERHKVRNRN